MLTAARINAAKPKEKPYKLSDSHGLFLFISPSGGKLWRMKYRFGPKNEFGKVPEKLLSFGSYPGISLSEAREKRDAARKQLANGIDPGETKKTEKTVRNNNDNFESVAREWHKKFSSAWTQYYSDRILRRLELYVFPSIGKRPIKDLSQSAPDILAVLQKIEQRQGYGVLHKVKNICSQIFRYASATGRAIGDPTALLKGAFPAKETKHYASITDPRQVAALLKAIDDFEGYEVTKYALKLLPLLFVRPGELRFAEWSEFDLDSKVWIIPKTKMKMNRDHIVPLSKQAIELIIELKFFTGSGRYLFPGIAARKNPISDNTLNQALRRIGYTRNEMTAHGFRATARTILDEVLHVEEKIIEHQLAHKVKDHLGRAYNRTAFIKERTEMMQLWSDYLYGLKAETGFNQKVIPFPRQA